MTNTISPRHAIKQLWCRALLATAMVVALPLGASTPALAQPDPNDQPKAQNPPAQIPFGNWQELQKLPPEERRAAVRQITERVLRDALTFTGFEDKSLQDAVVATALERENALDIVREKHRAVTRGLVDKAVTDEEMSTLVADLQAASATAKTQSVASIAALEEKVQFSRKPKLAAFLSLTGVTGDESALLGGILGNILGAMANVGAGQPAAAEPPVD